jgi:hypothetical protein
MIAWAKFLKIYFSLFNDEKKEIYDVLVKSLTQIGLYTNEPIKFKWLGAYWLSHSHLHFFYVTKTEETRKKLAQNAQLKNELSQIISSSKLQIETIEDCFSFDSEENIKTKSNGDWHIHFK